MIQAVDLGEIGRNLSNFLRGMALAGYQRDLRGRAMELADLFELLCFMELVGLPNPATVYLLEVFPYVLDEFHLWHRRMGMDRSPLASFSCC
jgi:hypothetical protein